MRPMPYTSDKYILMHQTSVQDQYTRMAVLDLKFDFDASFLCEGIKLFGTVHILSSLTIFLAGLY